MSTYLPQPGDIGLTQISGRVGLLVAIGQLFNGDNSRYTHAFLVLDDGTLVEAEPGGAKIASLTKYAGRPVRYSRYFPLTDEQRKEIVKVGRTLVGTPYSFLDYLALALVRLKYPSARLRAYVASSNHMICSQLVDYAYCKAGVHLFDDGRPSQDVTPGDLDAVLSEDW